MVKWLAILGLVAMGCGGTVAAEDSGPMCCWTIDTANKWVEKCDGADVGPEDLDAVRRAAASDAGRAVCSTSSS